MTATLGAERGERDQPATGRLFVIAAPSGAGKTTLIRALVASDPALQVAVSHTTRSPRTGERDGVHYYFVDASTFAAMRERGEFLESATVFGHCYGTSKQAVSEAMRHGDDVILEIDWQGAEQVRASSLGAVSIFLLPPCREILVERLRGRGQDTAEEIAKRAAQALDDISHHAEFDHLVVNDTFNAALTTLRDVVAATRRGEKPALRDHSALLRKLLS